MVNQAVDTLKTHLPGAITVNFVTKAADGLVHVSTYPTMLTLIDHPCAPLQDPFLFAYRDHQ
jgi:type I site-specific restriction endonuclease